MSQLSVFDDRRKPTSRRQFLATSTQIVGLVGGTLLGPLGMAMAQEADVPPDTLADAEVQRPVCVFAKHLQAMPWDELASFCAEIEVDGIEATIRGGGQVEPRDAVEGLPRLSDALGKTQSRIVIMTTDIATVNAPHAESILRTGAILGVTHYRMGYYRYDLQKPLLPQLDAFSQDAIQLAKLNHALGLTGLYQNHAGPDYVGGPLWDLMQVLAEIPKSDIALAYDVRHATVEGNQSWPADLARVRDSIGALFVKDYRAIDGRIENVPLGEGDVSEALFKSLRQSLPPGPISLHMEYISHTDPKRLADCANAYRRDRQSLKRLLGV